GDGADFGVALGDRSHEADLDRLADGDVPVLVDRRRGGVGAEALDQGRVDAAVHEAVGLAQLVAQLDAGARVVRIESYPLGTDVVVKGRRFLNRFLAPHCRAPY